MIDSKLNTIMNPEDDGIVRIIPEPWTQIDAVFDSIQIDDFDVILKIYLPHSKHLALISFPKDSPEGVTLLGELNKKLIKTEIQLLFTDIENRRLIIRK